MFKWLRKKEKRSDHFMVGKIYKLDNNNPFKVYLVRVDDVKANNKGEEWVKFSMIFRNGVPYARDCHERMDKFMYCYKECIK